MWKFIGKEPQPSKSTYLFKLQHSFNKREAQSRKILIKYPEYVPVIIEKSDHCQLAELKKTRYLFPKTFTIANVLSLIRTEIKLTPSEAIFLFVDNSIIPANRETVGLIYNLHHDKDGFLYITYTSENTFG